MNVNLKAASRAMDIAGPLPLMPIGDLTRDGVKTFVDAQRALMEAVTKTHEHKPAKPIAQRRRCVRRRLTRRMQWFRPEGE